MVVIHIFIWSRGKQVIEEYGRKIKEIKALCDLEVGGQKGIVYYPFGICSALTATQYKDPHKVLLKKNGKARTHNNGNRNQYFLGNYKNTAQGFVGSVYSPCGVSPTIRARDYKDPLKICVKSNAEWYMPNT